MQHKDRSRLVMRTYRKRTTCPEELERPHHAHLEVTGERFIEVGIPAKPNAESGIGLELFDFIPDSVFIFIPESRSLSPGIPTRDQCSYFRSAACQLATTVSAASDCGCALTTIKNRCPSGVTSNWRRLVGSKSGENSARGVSA